MSAPDLYIILLIAILVWATYQAGKMVGEYRQQNLWREHMEKSSRYAHAVDDLDKWCGNQSPHARLIARQLKAIGEGLGLNAGTPTGDEACTVVGLREQLLRLDKAQKGGQHDRT